MTYITPELQAQAQEMVRNLWDWYPDASLPPHLILAAFPEGIFVVEACCDLNKAVKLERVADAWR